MRQLLLIFSCSFLLFHQACSQSPSNSLHPGLKQPTEIIRDRWGVNHIYAKNEHDLFWAQGYSAAQDRLFQLEIWRRQATGTVAELLGPQEVLRDQGARLFRFRATGGKTYRAALDAELNHYHPHGAVIIRAFVEGINAYIEEIKKTPEKLPFEFSVLKTEPSLWTPEIVISRHQGLLGNVRDELDNGRLVHLISADKLRQLRWFHPRSDASATKPESEPDLTLRVDGEQLMQPILELYEAFRLPLKFSSADGRLRAESRPAPDAVADWFDTEKQMVGSNNWIIDGKHSVSGYPMLANDPHRAQSTPSLRYWVHLNAPGWNVVGGGEPTLPGISIGHNDFGAWGLTIFETDSEDLYVYETNPKNPNQYWYKGKWETMRIIRETIPVKGSDPVTVELKYTRHGPVTFEDSQNHKAYAVRAGWLERGCAPYLASLRMNQAKTWAEFRQACSFSRIPGENMIWAGRPSAGRPMPGRPSAEKKGTIGWQAVGISPIRKNWTGLVPVPGDGRFEWGGYLPILQLPAKANPPEGFIVTANNNLTPPDYPHRNAIGWTWAGPYRAHRIEEVLSNGQRKTVQDFTRLQADYLALPARSLVPLLEPLVAEESTTEQASTYLRKWNYQLEPGSVAASIYVVWEAALRQALYAAMVPRSAQPYFRSLPTKRILDWLSSPLIQVPGEAGQPIRVMDRDSLLLTCLTRAVGDLTTRLGPDMNDWAYGQRANKHITLTHPLSALVNEEQRKRINLGPIPRGGYSETVNSTGNSLNQTHGASFRIVVDTEDWDRTLGINSPGQSGDPNSPHYRDLFELWGSNGYFPVYFSKEKIKAVAEKTTVLRP